MACRSSAVIATCGLPWASGWPLSTTSASRDCGEPQALGRTSKMFHSWPFIVGIQLTHLLPRPVGFSPRLTNWSYETLKNSVRSPQRSKPAADRGGCGTAHSACPRRAEPPCVVEIPRSPGRRRGFSPVWRRPSPRRRRSRSCDPRGSRCSPGFRRHQMREGPHALHGEALPVEGQEIDRHVGRHLEVRGAVIFHVDEPPDLLRRVGGPARDHRELKAERPQARVHADRLGDLLHDRDAGDLAALHIRFQALVDILHADRCPAPSWTSSVRDATAAWRG